MSHVKASGKVAQHSQKQRKAKRLGVKKYAGEKVIVGNILIRQRGAKYKMGKDHTIFAMTEGKVEFGKRHGSTTVSVVPNA